LSLADIEDELFEPMPIMIVIFEACSKRTRRPCNGRDPYGRSHPAANRALLCGTTFQEAKPSELPAAEGDKVRNRRKQLHIRNVLLTRKCW
jgi:hypothetical protein